MSGGGGASASNAAAVSQIDPRLYSDWQQLNQQAKNVAATPYQAYGGKLVADDNMFEDLAQYKTLMAADMGQGNIGRAGKVLGEVADGSPMFLDAPQTGDVLDVNAERANAGSIPGSDLSKYMNPYESQVVQRSLADIDLQRDRQANADNANTQRGAFGGSRQGVADALRDERFDQQQLDTVAGLRQQGYDRATGLLTSDLDRGAGVGMFNAGQINDAMTGNANRDIMARDADANRRLATGQGNQQMETDTSRLNIDAARGLLGAADQEQSQTLRGAEALGLSGSTQRNADQQRLDSAYDQWLQQINYPKSQLDILAQPFGLVPSNQQSTSNSKSKSANAQFK